jgi:hypothetical protein
MSIILCTSRNKSIAMFYGNVIDQFIQEYFELLQVIQFCWIPQDLIRFNLAMLSLESRCTLRRYP